MAERSSYFDSYNGFPEYTAQDVAERTADLTGKRTGYIAGNREELIVSVADTTIYLHPGAALIEGRLYVNDSNKSFVAELCESGKTRIDRVILKLDTDVDSLNILSYIKQGEEGVSGVTAPVLTMSGTVYEISVAQLIITDVSISVIDERDSEFCGAVYTPESVNNKISDITDALDVHKTDTNNPHSITKEQIDLGNVDNTADADKPISNAQAAVNASKADKNLLNVLATDFITKAGSSGVLINTDIINDLTTGGTNKALSAEQGKIIREKIIEESGINANGYYIKFADGTMVAHGRNYQDSAAFAATGNVYYRVLNAITFPAEFYASPDINANIEFGNVGACRVGGITTTSFTPVVISAVSQARTVDVYYIAIGRWKE